MARVTGQSTPNLSVPTLGDKDNLDKATFNELITRLDTRINVVADETQALTSHESATTSVHGIADTSDLVATTDTPADGEVLTYTTAGGVNWAAASGGGGSEVVFAASANVSSFLGNVTEWSNVFVTNGASHSSGTITLTDNGIYHITTRAVFYNGSFGYELITLEHQTGSSTPFAYDYAYLKDNGKTTITTSIVRDNSSGTNNTIRVSASAFSSSVTWDTEDVFIVVTKIA